MNEKRIWKKRKKEGQEEVALELKEVLNFISYTLIRANGLPTLVCP